MHCEKGLRPFVFSAPGKQLNVPQPGFSPLYIHVEYSICRYTRFWAIPIGLTLNWMDLLPLKRYGDFDGKKLQSSSIAWPLCLSRYISIPILILHTTGASFWCGGIRLCPQLWRPSPPVRGTQHRTRRQPTHHRYFQQLRWDRWCHSLISAQNRPPTRPRSSLSRY